MQIITTTPRPTRLMKMLLADPQVAHERLPTERNAKNLAGGSVEELTKRYGGTRLGRQELEGELVEDREDALWSREMRAGAFVPEAGEMRRIVVAVDPPASSRKTS